MVILRECVFDNGYLAMKHGLPSFFSYGFRIILCAAVLFSNAAPVFAQALPLDLDRRPEKEEPVEDNILNVVPRVFSAHLKTQASAEKLDVIYNDLYRYLWTVSQTDQNHKENLLDLISPERFQYIRKSVEFKKAMDATVLNYKKSQDSITGEVAKAQEQFQALKESFKDEAPQATALWDKKIKEFEAAAADYFKLQNQYMKIYHVLVKFFLANPSGYYYNKINKKITFYQPADTKFYIDSINTLNKIDYDQRMMLKSYRPLFNTQ